MTLSSPPSAAAPTTSDDAALASLAAALLRATRNGVLSTLSATHDGWPFGSIVPYAIARDGALLLALSDLAEHTRNVRADARGALFVQDRATQDDDPQAGARISVLGRVAHIEAPDARDDARARYLARHPRASGFLSKLDFRLYALPVGRVRLIAGFGRIAWLEGAAVRAALTHDPLGDDARRAICEHMNGDHADALALYARAFAGRDAAVRPTLASVDAHGIDLVEPASGDRLRFEFHEPAATPDAVRRALVRFAREAREQLGIAAPQAPR